MLTSRCGTRLLARLKRTVKIFQRSARASSLDLRFQLISQSPLGLDRLEHERFSFCQGSQLSDFLLDGQNLIFVKATRFVFSKPRDKGNRVAFIKQLNGQS